MKFLVSSPDTLLFDRSELKKDTSRNQQIAISIIALIAVGTQVALFLMVHKLMNAMAASL